MRGNVLLGERLKAIILGRSSGDGRLGYLLARARRGYVSFKE
ncbi:MAG TPA: hypothetical protein PLO37_14560 [Candidatus Hydrogenedentes bacterium]|nr:hypothetical protein [Candidatus Hydrogenedentota bacterium]